MFDIGDDRNRSISSKDASKQAMRIHHLLQVYCHTTKRVRVHTRPMIERLYSVYTLSVKDLLEFCYLWKFHSQGVIHESKMKKGETNNCKKKISEILKNNRVCNNLAKRIDFNSIADTAWRKNSWRPWIKNWIFL